MSVPAASGTPRPPARTPLTPEQREARKQQAKVQQRRLHVSRRETSLLLGMCAMLLVALPVGWSMASDQQHRARKVVYRQQVVQRQVTHVTSWVTREKQVEIAQDTPAAATSTPAPPPPPPAADPVVVQSPSSAPSVQSAVS